MMMGNIFFPIPAVIAPIMKPFQIWGIPFFFPSGMLLKWSFFFADRGGCFYANGSPSKHGTGNITLTCEPYPNPNLILTLTLNVSATPKPKPYPNPNPKPNKPKPKPKCDRGGCFYANGSPSKHGTGNTTLTLTVNLTLILT